MLDAMSDVLKTMYYDLTRMIWRPIEDPKWFRDNKVRPIKGVLLHGLPGTGKSQLARAVRQECNRQMENKVSFYGLTGAKLMNGDPVANLEELFRAAAEFAPSVIFLDEVDCLFADRGADSHAVLTMLDLLDGVSTDHTTRIFVMAATNKYQLVHKSLLRPGRLQKQMEVKLPEEAERLQLLKIFCQNFDVSRVKMDKVAKDTEGFSPSDLAALVYEASDLASTDSNKTLVGPVSRWIHNNDTHTKIAGKHFFLAFSKITPSNQL